MSGGAFALVVLFLVTNTPSSQYAQATIYLPQSSVRWSLDPTFGNAGRVRLSAYDTYGAQYILRPDGKLIALVQHYIASRGVPVPVSSTISLIDSVGHIEASISSQGLIIADGVQSDNKLLAGGIRYNTDLSADSTFTTQGWADLPEHFGNQRNFILSDNKLLVAGNDLSAFPSSMPLR